MNWADYLPHWAAPIFAPPRQDYPIPPQAAPQFPWVDQGATAFDAAAARTRNSVMPDGGRTEGLATRLPEAMVQSLATLPQRMGTEATRHSMGLDYDIAPFTETAMMAVGTPAGAGGLGSGVRLPPGQGIRAYHGSPHDFDRFDLSKIGTGEGAQAYGHGLYFAEKEGVARAYRDNLSSWPAIQKQVFNPDGTPNRPGQVAEWLSIGRPESEFASTLKILDPNASEKQIAAWIAEGKGVFDKAGSSGRMYEVNINAKPEQFLDWDKPLTQQPAEVTNRLLDSRFRGYLEDPTLSKMPGRQLTPQTPYAAEKLNDIGIPGIKYLDQGSRTAGEGSRNYVVFDDKLIDILRKYGIAPLLGGAPFMMQDHAPAQ